MLGFVMDRLQNRASLPARDRTFPTGRAARSSLRRRVPEEIADHITPTGPLP